MKTRTIRKVLKNKFETFTKSIKDEKVRKLVEQNSIITGGAIVSLLLNDEPNDFDIYFTNAETAFEVAKYYFDQMPDRDSSKDGVEIWTDPFTGEDRVRVHIQSTGTLRRKLKKSEIGKNKFVPVFMTDNAITLSDGVQLVMRFIGPADEIHKNYDFVHCTSHWESKTGSLVLPAAALEAIITKELRYVGSQFPICSLIRIRKFIERGFTINAGQILKIVWQIKDLDLEDTRVLSEQLLGVDAAYFASFIHKLNMAAKSDTELTSGYISQLLDEIFDSPELVDTPQEDELLDEDTEF